MYIKFSLFFFFYFCKKYILFLKIQPSTKVRRRDGPHYGPKRLYHCGHCLTLPCSQSEAKMIKQSQGCSQWGKKQTHFIKNTSLQKFSSLFLFLIFCQYCKFFIFFPLLFLLNMWITGLNRTWSCNMYKKQNGKKAFF